MCISHSNRSLLLSLLPDSPLYAKWNDFQVSIPSSCSTMDFALLFQNLTLRRLSVCSSTRWEEAGRFGFFVLPSLSGTPHLRPLISFVLPLVGNNQDPLDVSSSSFVVASYPAYIAFSDAFYKVERHRLPPRHLIHSFPNYTHAGSAIMLHRNMIMHFLTNITFNSLPWLDPYSSKPFSRKWR